MEPSPQAGACKESEHYQPQTMTSRSGVSHLPLKKRTGETTTHWYGVSFPL